jgi:hypothetical protein
MFYRTIAQSRLTASWHYESACAYARRTDDTRQLSRSVLLRCARALEARDYLGQLYYTPNADGIADRALYHFDYLTLLLFGAFDALGRVAHRVYGVTQPNERGAGLHRQDYRNALRGIGATNLEAFISQSRVQGYSHYD